MDLLRSHRMRSLVFLLAAVLAMSWGLSAQSDDGSGTDPAYPPGEVNGEAPQAPPPPAPPGCFASNIQMSAQGSVSSGGSTPPFNPEVAHDGILGPPPCDQGGWAWVDTSSCPVGAPCGEWYMLEWPQAISVCQIFVDTKPAASDSCGAGENRIMSDATIQYWDGGDWVTVGSVAAETDDWTFMFPPGVVTTRIRLFDVFTDPTPPGQDDNPLMYELVVYDGSGAPVPAAPVPWKLALVLVLVVIGISVLVLRR